jgi:hypothetical protein
LSIELLRNEIMRFLSSEEPEVICITGKWGVGKTWSWKQFLKDAQNKKDGIALNRYAYASLFGINSLNDLKYTIFENTVNKDQVVNDANIETFKSVLESAEVLGRKSAWVLNLIPGLKSSLGAAAPAFFLMVRSQIICIDDLERKGKNLDVGDVLGLISFLKDQRNCKIALLLNDGALPEDQKEDFHKYLEKVVDVSLNFDPTSEESVKIAFKENTKENGLISEHCIKLGISNIRIIRKIGRLVREIAPMLTQFDEQVFLQAVQSLTLLGWSAYAIETAPPVDYLKERNRFRGSLKKEIIPEKEGAWNALLDAYGFSAMDDFDLALLNGVKNGFFDPGEIKKIALELDARIKAKKSAESFWQAWGQYYDSFENNQEEVIITLYESFFRNVQYLNPNDLNGTVCLFKELGEYGKATNIIKYFIDNRQGDRRFFDPDRYAGIFKIDDPDVISAFKIKCESFKDDIDPTELIVRMAEERGWDNEDFIMLSELSVDDYYRIFKLKSGDELRLIISFCLQFDNISNPSPQMVEISSRAKEALKRIGQESPINARRVRKYVNVDNPTPTE